jgi:hypothetical protein
VAHALCVPHRDSSRCLDLAISEVENLENLIVVSQPFLTR